MKLQRTATKIFDTIIDYAAAIGGVVVGVVMLLVVGAVVTRYGMHLSQAWIIEVVGYCLFFITFLGTAWLLKINGHVRMDVIVDQRSPKTQAVIGIFVSSLSIIIMGILVWYGIDTINLTIEKGYNFGMGLRPPMAALLWAIPFGCLALLIQFARNIHRYLHQWKTGVLPGATREEEEPLSL